MGKSWKEKPGKYRYNRDFQKKQQKKHNNKPIPFPIKDEDIPSSPLDDSPEYHESFA